MHEGTPVDPVRSIASRLTASRFLRTSAAEGRLIEVGVEVGCG
jgi:hypothetical protein